MNKWSNEIKYTLSSDCFSASRLRRLPENQARNRYVQAMMKKEEIDLMLKTNRRKFNFWVSISYYALGHFFSFLPFLSIYEYFKMLNKYGSCNKDGLIFLVIVGLVGIFFAPISYAIRYRQLKFKIIPTKLTTIEIEKAINKTIKDLEWKIIDINYNYVNAKGVESFYGFRDILIIIDNERVLINSVYFNPSFVYGWNTKIANHLKKNLIAST